MTSGITSNTSFCTGNLNTAGWYWNCPGATAIQINTGGGNDFVHPNTHPSGFPRRLDSR